MSLFRGGVSPWARAAGLVAVVLVAAGAALAVYSAGDSVRAADPVGPNAAAPPHVLPYATGALPPARPDPARERAPLTGSDGCDHSYGRPEQCVPWVFPPGGATGCAWLRAHGFGPLAVHGADRHRLDGNRDRVACGPGD